MECHVLIPITKLDKIKKYLINDEKDVFGKVTKKAVPLQLLLSIMEMLKRLSSFF